MVVAPHQVSGASGARGGHMTGLDWDWVPWRYERPQRFASQVPALGQRSGSPPRYPAGSVLLVRAFSTTTTLRLFFFSSTNSFFFRGRPLLPCWCKRGRDPIEWGNKMEVESALCKNLTTGRMESPESPDLSPGLSSCPALSCRTGRAACTPRYLDTPCGEGQAACVRGTARLPGTWDGSAQAPYLARPALWSSFGKRSPFRLPILRFRAAGGRVKDGFRSRVESVLIQEGENFSFPFFLFFASSRTSFISRSDMAMARHAPFCKTPLPACNGETIPCLGPR
ncbi:hypothetical protein CI102_795 [Trichoderma harzianum]|uniref:Uncharacterized protein n=1 Tax=Trichoderma harzianum CBS 226.95 TaxID=983964 RepID=A0A2T3ZYX0_TRIHA|nr:hypothetical protein M431DRAFT_258598 [Trichoderma harzianum CBS 226.95]PKK54504.1 hypothetical protein CI102_795 [Trichoderma harzianum]PTB50011.1 hypothetical protein M431DRAFT_258598 [Trichoderma harzianum CBS 226.95]